MDYRFHDLPTRPYVPWQAGLASYEIQRLPPLAASPSRMKRRRLDVCCDFLCSSTRPLTAFSRSLCFGLCVVHVASLRAPGPAVLLHDPFDVQMGNHFTSIFPRTACFFLFLGVSIYIAPTCSRYLLRLIFYLDSPPDLNALHHFFFGSIRSFSLSLFVRHGRNTVVVDYTTTF